LYGTADLDTAAESRPVEWEELDTEKTNKKEGGEGDMEEGDGEEEAVDQFLEDVGYDGEKEDPATHDPDYIPTPLMKQFKVIVIYAM
jgi:hypothetical protein